MSCVVKMCRVVCALEVFFSEFRIANFYDALFAVIVEYGDVVFAAYFLDSLDDRGESGLVNMPTKKFVTIIITAKPWCILFYSIFFAYFL